MGEPTPTVADLDRAIEQRRAALKVLDAEIAAKQGTLARLTREIEARSAQADPPTDGA